MINPIPQYYVYYESKTGKILSITNEKDDQYQTYLEVDHDEISGFFTGQKLWHEYVVRNVKTTDNRIIPSIISIETPTYDFKNNDFLNIGLHSVKNADLKISWDLPNSCWRFALSNDAKKIFKDNIFKGAMMFFVTLEDDFDFLIRTIIIDVDTLFFSKEIKIPFESSFELKPKKTSILTIQIFRSYSLKLYE